MQSLLPLSLSFLACINSKEQLCTNALNITAILASYENYRLSKKIFAPSIVTFLRQQSKGTK
jgi:hypothetical protein